MLFTAFAFLFLGVPTKVKLSVITPENYPVDLYYLMDLSASMGDDKQKILDLGNQLGKLLNSHSDSYIMFHVS